MDTISATASILNTSTTMLNSLREQAQRSKDDSALKASISGFYDEFLRLKEITLRLMEENRELHRAIKRHSEGGSTPVPEARQAGKAVYYFVGEQGPYCQPCYVKNTKLVLLPPIQETGRFCAVCGAFFQELESRRQNQISGSGW